MTYAPQSLIVRTSRSSFISYGQIGTTVGRLLDSRGFPAQFFGLGTDARYLPVDHWVESRTVQAPPRFASVFQVAQPEVPPPGGRRTVCLTMWESTRIRPEWAAHLDRSEAVVVPCRFNEDGFRASGVTVPIHVVPLGIDPSEYSYRPLPLSGPFVFGMAARMSHGGIRKGINEGMTAFVKAFDQGEDVRLSVKVFEDCLPFLNVPDDRRIEVVTEAMTPAMMAEWYGKIHCLLVPSKGEGWGLHTLQAMACGRPVIACKQSGTAEFFDASCGWDLPFTMRPAGEFYAGMGEWAVPLEEGMVESMRQAFRSPGRIYRKGLYASRRAALFTWDRTGDTLLKALAEVPGFLPPLTHKGTFAQDRVCSAQDTLAGAELTGWSSVH